jgi:hypothetical protein
VPANPGPTRRCWRGLMLRTDLRHRGARHVSALALAGQKVMFRRWKPKPQPSAPSPRSIPSRRRPSRSRSAAFRRRSAAESNSWCPVIAKPSKTPPRRPGLAASISPENYPNLASPSTFEKVSRHLAIMAARAGAVKGELLDSANEMVRDRSSSFVLGLAGIAPAPPQASP